MFRRERAIKRAVIQSLREERLIGHKLVYHYNGLDLKTKAELLKRWVVLLYRICLFRTLKPSILYKKVRIMESVSEQIIQEAKEVESNS